MPSSQDDDSQGLALGVVFTAIVLAVGLTVGVAMYHLDKRSQAGASTSASAVVDASAAGGNAGLSNPALPASGANGANGVSGTNLTISESASVMVENGVVKFYFESGKAELAAGAKEALGDIVKGVAAGQTAVISGFHDATGDLAQNEALALQRAQAVRDTLVSLGIGEDKLELQKPEATTATGSNAQARRVEVRLQ